MKKTTKFRNTARLEMLLLAQALRKELAKTLDARKAAHDYLDHGRNPE